MAPQGGFLRVDPTVEDFKMVAQLGGNDVEGKGYYLKIGSEGRYLKKTNPARERRF